MSPARIRVLLVDDDDLMRAGLRAVLSSDATIEVVSEAGDGRAAIGAARQHRPDMILMDVRMPDLDGISATREILARSADARIVILTTFEDDDYIFGALSADASGFLLKRTRPEDLIAAIHTIAAGDSLLSPSVTRRVIDEMASRPGPRGDSQRLLDELTPRERDVLALIARGLSNAEIAATLVVEESTVKTRVKRILGKLRLRDRVQAVILAYGRASPSPAASTNAPGSSPWERVRVEPRVAVHDIRRDEAIAGPDGHVAHRERLVTKAAHLPAGAQAECFHDDAHKDISMAICLSLSTDCCSRVRTDRQRTPRTHPTRA